ncbi:MAG: thylakoid membrane photosystem I accumulation factor [Cyanobacteriota bacterium]
MRCLSPASAATIPAAAPGSVLPLRFQSWLAAVLAMVMVVATVLVGRVEPAAAARTTNSYDGNIYALYAGNGSLVPPRSTLEQALNDHRPVVLAFYLDDSADSKTFAPTLSELQRLWGPVVELILLPTDPLQGRAETGPSDPAHYWNGTIPQVVVLDAEGSLRFDASGQVDVDAINTVLASVTGLALPENGRSSRSLEVNELNSEIVSRS